MKRHTWLCAALLTSTAIAGFSHLARAQNASIETIPEIAANELEMREIAVNNVPIRFMAWWIDNQHNEEPFSFHLSRLNREAVGAQDSPQPKRIFDNLPTGVLSAIVASDKRNSLLVVGTKSGIETIENAVKKSDVPLRQVEVRMQAFEISEREAKNLGLNFTAISGKINAGRATPISVAKVPNLAQLQARLQTLIVQEKAKFAISRTAITQSEDENREIKMTALNGLTDQLSSTQLEPATIGTLSKGSFHSWLQAASLPATNLYVGMDSGLYFTPWINDDDTVTVNLMPLKTLQVSANNTPDDPKNPAQGWPFTRQKSLLRTLEGFRHTVIFNNGQTLAFSGLSPSLFDTNSFAPRKTGNLMLLVTARILPRLGEDETPGN